MAKVLFLFDLDGTLVSLGALHRQAIEGAFLGLFGARVNLDEVPTQGATHYGIFQALARRHGISPEAVDQNFSRAVEGMARDLEAAWPQVAATVLLPGVLQTLAAIRSAGNQAGILSGNPGPIGRTVLRLGGLEGQFAPCFFSDRQASRHTLVAQALTQVPAGLQVVIVGDTPADIAAARSNHLASVAVLTGVYTQAGDFADTPPDRMIKDLVSAPAPLWDWRE